jgi:hypothetical protein
VRTAAGPLIEFPPTVARVGRFALPVGGGGYFRLYPYRMTRSLLSKINRTERRPFMFYCHPWEIDPGQPRMQGASLLSQLRHYVNLATTEQKVNQLLNDFAFGPMESALSRETVPSTNPVAATIA